MPAFILSTCGTSLITNGISSELRPHVNQITNLTDLTVLPDGMPADLAATLSAHIADRTEALMQADEAQVRRMSAELNGLLAWQAIRDAHKADVYALLATDTWLGQQTAQMIEAWLHAKGHQTLVLSQRGLRTSSLSEFRGALSALTQHLAEALSDYRQSGYHIAFNLTGGFKGLNGFLQAVATIYADETFYLFEGSSELLTIPRLPLTLDAEATVRAHLTAFRRLNAGLPVSATDVQGMADTLLFWIDDHATLSEWGELLWHNSYKTLYQDAVLPSPSPHVVFAPEFVPSTKKLLPDLIALVNERIDALAKYVEEGGQHMLASLDAKPLQEAKYKKDNIWEFDLDPHHRVFMQKQGNGFLLQKVDASLH